VGRRAAIAAAAACRDQARGGAAIAEDSFGPLLNPRSAAAIAQEPVTQVGGPRLASLGLLTDPSTIRRIPLTILRTAVHERIDELDRGSDNLGEPLRQMPTERTQLPPICLICGSAGGHQVTNRLRQGRSAVPRKPAVASIARRIGAYARSCAPVRV
jgi:hypothetical protein